MGHVILYEVMSAYHICIRCCFPSFFIFNFSSFYIFATFFSPHSPYLHLLGVSIVENARRRGLRGSCEVLLPQVTLPYPTVSFIYDRGNMGTYKRVLDEIR